MGNPLFVEMMNAMGGNGVAMGFNEHVRALQTGVVDGAENNQPTVLAQNHYTVSKVYSRTGHLIIPEIFVFSKRSWDALSKSDQDLVKKLSREAQIEQRQLWDAYVGEAETKLKAAGVTFVGRQGGVLQGDAARTRQVRRQVRRAPQANPGHEVLRVAGHARCPRVPFFCIDVPRDR